ncbi:unnamed protein product [Staurois parvus]|uniref:Uncharacterized protein n=1 Tax=Staurois parvus TaxID=386267 RepID=A0ABN9DIB5_9NEOB|nr:unnamed protein product [Staurois parvus]
MQVTIEDVHANCGETAQFDAVIDGSPPLTITWYKDNTLLKDSDRFQLVRDGRKCSLVIRSTERGDGGVYTCVARNSGGEVSCKAELVMQEEEKEDDTKIVHKRRKLKSFFEVKEEIGRGSFGFVKRVVHKGNGATCAAKFIPLRSKTRQQAYHERDILSEVSHERITLLLDAFETKKTLILILEICCGEELLDRLFRKHTITEKEVKLYIRQLLEAVAYLHEKNILHLDIKPSNILMVHTDKEDIKLCDFGFSQKIIQSEFQYSKYGSPEFVPPEIAAQAPVSKSSDIWPVGVISYLCLVSASPFAGQNDRETLMNVQQAKISWSCPGFTQLGANAQDFMRQAIQRSPDARPSATQCLQHKWFVESSSPEDTQPVSSKNLRFLVARSRWQRSLMCYKSILVMRSIPELLNGKQESTSLGVPRHLVECSSSSSSSGSSSDNESDVSPTARDCNPSLELHLSIFKMSEKDGLQQPYTPEPEMDKNTKCITQEEEKMESKDVTIHDTSPMIGTKREHDKASGLGESQEDLEDDEKMLVHSVETSPGMLPLHRSATIEVGVLASKKAKTGAFVRGTSADSALRLPKGSEKPSLVCVPRQSIINSTFYNQAGEGQPTAPRDGTLKDKDFIKHRERARRSLMKAGYSQKILSGLREPLLEQFAMEQRILSQDPSQMDQLGSLKKSASFDLAKVSLRSSFKVSSRSRSLDDYRSRPLSVYKGTVVEEKDHISTKTSKEALNKSDTAITKPHSEEFWTAPPKKSSTQRPLSAPPSDRDNAIIAVFHQQPLQDMSDSKARSSSAVLGGEESTIITFIKPKQVTESESLAKPHTVVIKDTDVWPTPQSPGKASEEKEQPTDLQTGVKFTVHTTSQRNEFLASDVPVEKTSDRVNTFFPKDEEGEEEAKIFAEGQIQIVHFREDNSRIAVIHQSAGDFSAISKDTTTQEEVAQCPTIMMQSEPVPDLVFPERTPTELVIAAKHDREHKIKPYIEQMFEREDNLVISSSQTEHGMTVQEDRVQIAGKDLQFSVYKDEQSATIDELVGEMSSLSEEMEVLASEQKETSQGDPTFPSLVDQTDQTKEPPGLQDVGHFTGDSQDMETEPSPLGEPLKEPPITSISQCSFYESLSQAHVSPAPLENFEEFTIESCSSSKTFISHSDSSGTGRRSDNFSDLEETGRHSEVSLVEIGGIHRDASSNDSDKMKLVPFEFESTHLNDFYDILNISAKH